MIEGRIRINEAELGSFSETSRIHHLNGLITFCIVYHSKESRTDIPVQVTVKPDCTADNLIAKVLKEISESLYNHQLLLSAQQYLTLYQRMHHN